jgi:hypothetical protein
MAVVQMMIRRCLTVSEISLDDNARSVNPINAADNSLSFGPMKRPSGSANAVELQKPGIAAKKRSSS